MKPVLVLYATRERHTRRVAEYVAAALRAHNLVTHLVDAAHVREGFSPAEYSTAFLIASVRRSQHERAMIQYVKRHREELQRIPTAFLSTGNTADVNKMIDAFLAETAWRPTFVEAVAGALTQTKYNFVMRYMTNPSRDDESTDWKAIDRLVDEFAPAFAEPVPA